VLLEKSTDIGLAPLFVITTGVPKLAVPPLDVGIFNVPLLKVAAPLPVVVKLNGAENAPLPFKKAVAVPELVPKRAAGIVPVVAEPKAVTILLPEVALLAIVVTADEDIVTSPVTV